jgi:hypothetical protein
MTILEAAESLLAAGSMSGTDHGQGTILEAAESLLAAGSMSARIMRWPDT